MGAIELSGAKVQLLRCQCDYDQEADAWRVQFRTVDEQAGTDHGQCIDSSAASHYSSAQLIVLLPSELVLLTKLTLPSQSQVALNKLIPFAVEDQLAMDVADCFFAVGGQTDNGQQIVAVVQKKLMVAISEALDHLGLLADALVPDVLALQSELGSWSVEVEGVHTSVRTDAQLGFKIETPQAQAMLLAMLGDDESKWPNKIYYYDAGRAIDWRHFKQAFAKIHQLPIKHTLVSAEKLAGGVPLNLFQG